MDKAIAVVVRPSGRVGEGRRIAGLPEEREAKRQQRRPTPVSEEPEVTNVEELIGVSLGPGAMSELGPPRGSLARNARLTTALIDKRFVVASARTR